jgi:hypothetical protein
MWINAMPAPAIFMVLAGIFLVSPAGRTKKKPHPNWMRL